MFLFFSNHVSNFKRRFYYLCRRRLVKALTCNFQLFQTVFLALEKSSRSIFTARVFCLKMTLQTTCSHCVIAEIFIAYHALWYHLAIPRTIYKFTLSIITAMPSLLSFILCQSSYLFQFAAISTPPFINFYSPQGGAIPSLRVSELH